jgi:hypothetical protein
MTRGVPPRLQAVAAHPRLGAAGALTALVAATVGVNLAWVVHRRGLPFDIDEAGYLQRAVSDASALGHGLTGTTGLAHTLRSGDPQAPLLPVTAGIVRYVSGTGPYGLLAVPQLFYAAAVVATYLLARRFMHRGWSMLCAALVAAVPGLVLASRQFEFAVALTALFTATLAAQLATGGFRSLPRSLLWGVLLGLTTLTRTESLGLVPAVLLAAAMRLAVTRPGWAPVRNALGGVVVAFICSWWWYSASWHNVLKYLTDYGYGAQAAGYGRAHPPWSPAWWTVRATGLMNGALFAPLTVALIASAVCWCWRVRHRSATARSAWVGRLSQALGGDAATVGIVVVADYLMLSTTRNAGTYFALPLVPALVVLAVSTAAGAPSRRLRRAAATACLLAAVVSFAGVNAVPGLPTTSSVRLGSAHLVVFDGRQPPTGYTHAFRDGCSAATMCTLGVAGQPADVQLRRWVAPSETVAVSLQTWAAAHGRGPVVLFAVQDPLFNTNTVDLAYAVRYGAPLPTGLLRDPRAAGLSLPAQLDAPALGRPNFVISGTPSAVPAARAFAPDVEDAAVRAAVQADGFGEIGAITLPDGRVMHVWWHPDRGPVAARR